MRRGRAALLPLPLLLLLANAPARAEDSPAEQARALISQGYSDLQDRNLATAIGEFEAALKLTPADQQAHFYLGQSLRELGRYPAARQHFVIAAALAQTADDWRQAKEQAAITSGHITPFTQEVELAQTQPLSTTGRFYAPLSPQALMAVIGGASSYIEAMKVSGCEIIIAAVFPFPIGKLISSLDVQSFDDTKGGIQLENHLLLYHPTAAANAVTVHSARGIAHYASDTIVIKDDNAVNLWDVKLAYAALAAQTAKSCQR